MDQIVIRHRRMVYISTLVSVASAAGLGVVVAILNVPRWGVYSIAALFVLAIVPPYVSLNFMQKHINGKASGGQRQ